jgi:hypothetical protein
MESKGKRNDATGERGVKMKPMQPNEDEWGRMWKGWLVRDM